MLITCPECGHQVSDKAPVCPHCGVEIANHIPSPSTDEGPITDNAPIADEDIVMAEPIADDAPAASSSAPSSSVPYVATPSQPSSPSPQQPAPGKGHGTLIVSFLIAAIICATVLYFYKDAVDKREAEAKADTERVDTVEEQQAEESPTVVAETAEETAETPAEETTEEPSADPSTANAEEESAPATDEKAENAEKEAATPTAAEKQKAFMAVRRLFQAINAHNASHVRANTTSHMTHFGNTYNATPDDVVSYMNGLYGEGVTNLNFHLGTVSAIEKKTVEGKSEYEIPLPARKVVEHGDQKTETSHHVKATVTADGKVKAMTIK